MDRYVALLRGVNVGGKNKLAMASLASLFTAAKCSRVATYIQSGNVVFSADPKLAAKVTSLICEQINKQHGFRTTIVVRSLADMERIQTANPYFKPEIPLEKLHAVFLADQPTCEQVASLDPNRSPPDQFTVIGSEIYLYLPNGAADSKLTAAYFDARLKTVGTARNWRTMQKLLDMLRISQK